MKHPRAAGTGVESLNFKGLQIVTYNLGQQYMDKSRIELNRIFKGIKNILLVCLMSLKSNEKF